jgi:hypothetical protein
VDCGNVSEGKRNVLGLEIKKRGEIMVLQRFILPPDFNICVE